MNNQEPAQFIVTITSTENATWQGAVMAGEETGRFESEMQLFRWLMNHFPQLSPEHAKVEL